MTMATHAATMFVHPIAVVTITTMLVLVLICMINLRTRKKLKDDMTVADLQRSVNSAEQAMSKARADLDVLSKSDVCELKSLNAPPDGVKNVLDVVCIVMETEPSWKAAKKMMADPPQFLWKLRSYDVNHVPSAVRVVLHTFTSDPSLARDIIAGKSKAAAGICSFLHALAAYDKARAELQTKQAALLAATPWWQRLFMPRRVATNRIMKVAPARVKEARIVSRAKTCNRLALAKPAGGGNDAPFPLTHSYISDERFALAAPEAKMNNAVCCFPAGYASLGRREDKEWLLEPTVAMGTTPAADLRAHLPVGYGTGAGFDTALPPSGVVWSTLPVGVVATDSPTDAQLKVLAARASKFAATDGTLPEAVRNRKLTRLAHRVAEGSGGTRHPTAPPAAFFKMGLRV